MNASRAAWLLAGSFVFAGPASAQVPDPEFVKMARRAAVSDSVTRDMAALSSAGAAPPPLAPQSLVQPYGTWRMHPPPVLFGASTVLDPIHDRLVFACGSNGYLQKNVWTLSCVPGSTWQIDSLASAQSPGPLAYAATVYDPVHARMVMFGGLGYPATASNQVWSLSMGDPMVWSLVPTQGIAPPARWNALAAYDSRRNRLVVYGGEDGNGFKSDAWALTLGDTARWERLAPLDSIPPAKSEAAGICDPVGDRLLVCGGLSLDETGHLVPSQDLWQLSLGDTVRWRRIDESGMNRPRIAISSAAVYDPAGRRMFLFGGGGNGTLPWILDLNGSPTWTALGSAWEPLQRVRFTALYDQSRERILISGGTESGLDESDVEVLPLSGNLKWSSLGIHPRAPGRSRAITLYDARRNRMIVFGGSNSDFGDTWSMSLTNLDRWTRLSSSSSPRFSFGNPAGAYDSQGDRCFLFGESADDPPRNQLLVLSLADTSAAWQEFETTGDAPPPRARASMIYDPVRNRLVVYGGTAIDFQKFSISYYDEVWALPLDGSPRWRKLGVLGPTPGPRDSHWAFYDPTHDRMVIYGGNTPGPSVSLDPPEEQWWALSLEGQPIWNRLLPQGSGPSLYAQSIAYDSVHKRMLVQGGLTRGGSSQFNVSTWGLNLDPELRWEYLLTSGDPATGRWDGSSVYDPVGDRLVVYGGLGIFTPKNDVWSLEFSSVPYPAAWIVRSKVESGTVSLAWGCRDGAGTTATVYRKTDNSPWSALTSLQADATGEISFSDMPTGDHWRQTYRVGVTEGGVTTYSLPYDVQLQETRQPLLVGAYPNPSRAGDLQIRFQLPSPAAARLEMIDVRGRVVWARDVTASSPAIETLRLPAQKRSGVYLLRLLQDGKAATLKAVVLE